MLPELSVLQHDDYEGYNCKQAAVGVGVPVLGLPSWRHPQIKTSGSRGPLQLRLFIQNCCGPNPPQCKALSGSVSTGALGFWGRLSLTLFTEYGNTSNVHLGCIAPSLTLWPLTLLTGRRRARSWAH